MRITVTGIQLAKTSYIPINLYKMSYMPKLTLRLKTILAVSELLNDEVHLDSPQY
jgi:hypothetical protein